MPVRESGPYGAETVAVRSSCQRSRSCAACCCASVLMGSTFPYGLHEPEVRPECGAVVRGAEDPSFLEERDDLVDEVVEPRVAAFEAILPALGSGKYDVGTGDFGVTDERRKTIDFVTYLNDGQGFAVRDDSELGKVTDLTQLCGLTVGTAAGTTFEVTLEESRHRCSEAGKKPYDVKTYSDPAAVWSSLQQGRTDIVMSTINGLRYAVKQQEGVRFLNEFARLDVGFAFKKGTPPAPAFRAAVSSLEADGTYDRILKKCGIDESAIKASRISPPEIK
ncbi:transporter substrate-binding domain-containing protein [Streptomyces sp. NPDC048462]|uniref:transporter substrate-binding domain-containing protein n=1 Tax=Streptomyces sp. NPDC048462 TaxID=3365555 RepID=UPI003710ACF8